MWYSRQYLSTGGYAAQRVWKVERDECLLHRMHVMHNMTGKLTLNCILIHSSSILNVLNGLSTPSLGFYSVQLHFFCYRIHWSVCSVQTLRHCQSVSLNAKCNIRLDSTFFLVAGKKINRKMIIRPDKIHFLHILCSSAKLQCFFLLYSFFASRISDWMCWESDADKGKLIESVAKNKVWNTSI